MRTKELIRLNKNEELIYNLFNLLRSDSLGFVATEDLLTLRELFTQIINQRYNNDREQLLSCMDCGPDVIDKCEKIGCQVNKLVKEERRIDRNKQKKK